jgi:hypothetical protein
MLKKFITYIILITNIYCNKSDKEIDFSERFRVCGSYCGPGWCNNMWLDEDKCDATFEPEHHKITGYSCEDSCCRLHDMCCGKGKINQKPCNSELVNCLSKCNPFSLTCTIDEIPIIPFTIKTAMNIIDDWCCGSPCLKF